MELICPPGRGRQRNGGGDADPFFGGRGGGGGGEYADQEERGKAIRTVWTQFWSSHQRFFKSLYVASKVPFVIEQAQQALADGYAPVIGLQTTGEAAQARQGALPPPPPKKKGGVKGEAEDEEAYDEVSNVAHTLEQFLRNHVSDILGPGAAEMRHRYLQWLDGVRARLPGNPLDTLIDALGGPAQVAELTGRSLRRTADKKHAKVNVGQHLHEREREAFQRGVKKAAIISEAASVGISLHADRREASSHKRRLHFCLELAWGADRVMQQLGRTHRSNQASGACMSHPSRARLSPFICTRIAKPTSPSTHTRFSPTHRPRVQAHDLGAHGRGHALRRHGRASAAGAGRYHAGPRGRRQQDAGPAGVQRESQQ